MHIFPMLNKLKLFVSNQSKLLLFLLIMSQQVIYPSQSYTVKLGDDQSSQPNFPVNPHSHVHQDAGKFNRPGGGGSNKSRVGYYPVVIAQPAFPDAEVEKALVEQLEKQRIFQITYQRAKEKTEQFEKAEREKQANSYQRAVEATKRYEQELATQKARIGPIGNAKNNNDNATPKSQDEKKKSDDNAVAPSNAESPDNKQLEERAQGTSPKENKQEGPSESVTLVPALGQVDDSDHSPSSSNFEDDSLVPYDGPYAIPEAWSRFTGWVSGRTAREKAEKEAAEKERREKEIAWGKAAYENQVKQGRWERRENLHNVLYHLDKARKQTKQRDKYVSTMLQTRHRLMYATDEECTKAIESLQSEMYGEQFVSDICRKNHELKSAREAREIAEFERDLVLAENARCRFTYKRGEKTLSVTHQEQEEINKTLATISPDIIAIADQAAQRVEDLKLTHPYYQGQNPPRSPNEARRTKAAFDLRAYQEAEKKKADEIERSEATLERLRYEAEVQDARDRRSGKKLALQVMHGVLNLAGAFRGGDVRVRGWWFPPAQEGAINNDCELYINLSVVSKACRKIGAALGSVVYRNSSASVGSGGSKAPEERKTEQKKDTAESKIGETTNIEWTAHGYKHVAPKNAPWKDVVKSTKNGPAKYKHDINVEAIERLAWRDGLACTNGKPWKVKQFKESIGAKNGIETNCMRIEKSGNTIHGHPITIEEYFNLIQ